MAEYKIKGTRENALVWPLRVKTGRDLGEKCDPKKAAEELKKEIENFAKNLKKL